ncbi:MAG: succinate dehydrogenase cytochrome b subunit [Spirosomaceae bacterium]|nr:succinate dehydrogenase cytochrome b subunit [Spirosomataceae bacterium]
MSWLVKTVNSSIGRKVLMALTGLFLCTFLIVHMIGNLQLFNGDGGYSFNKYAVFMTTNPLIKTVSYGLYAMILFHAFWGLYVTYINRKARSARYAITNSSSTWASRNMAVLGTVLLVYIAVHMGDFWFDYKFGHVPFTKYVEDVTSGQLISQEVMPAGYTQEVKLAAFANEAEGTQTVIIKDLYAEVSEAFENIFIVLFYILSMGALAFHLVHGFQSGFQTLGLNHPKYNGLIKNIGIAIFAIAIPLAFAAMPIYFFLK